MALRLPFLLLTISLLSACGGHRIGPYEILGPRPAEIENLRSQAEQGTAEDQYNLGIRYEEGMVVPNDDREAAGWYRRAAAQEHREALYKLCESADAGRGMRQDYQEALYWCLKAADQGHGRAMSRIAAHYQRAQGVPRDLLQAHMWFNLASAHGDREAAKWRDRLAYDMSPSQVAQAHKLAREWSPRVSTAPAAPSP